MQRNNQRWRGLMDSALNSLSAVRFPSLATAGEGKGAGIDPVSWSKSVPDQSCDVDGAILNARDRRAVAALNNSYFGRMDSARG